MSLKDQVCIITGASRGIGKDLALLFAKNGANIVVCAKSTEEQSNLPGTIFSVAKECELFGVKALPIKCDVRNEKDIENVVAKTMEVFGRIDILINNAGALWWKNVEDTPMKRYDLINEVNSRASFSLTQKVLPHMLKANRGRIIVMSPPLDLTMLKGKVAYCISKFGMTLLALGLGQELEGTNVAICSLWPATMVESYATINFELGDKSMWRKASIISDASLLVCTDDPKNVNGKELIDEDYMKTRGVKDFTKYRCVPSIEPPRLVGNSWSQQSHNVGLVSENKVRSKM